MTNEEAAAILESEAEYLYSQDEPYNRQAFNMAIEALQERKTGKWIVWKDCEGKTRELTCSECGCQRRTWVNPNYCEDCGAKMEVDE